MRTSHRLTAITLALVAFLAFWRLPQSVTRETSPGSSHATAGPNAEPPKLVVVVVFDQMRGDYLSKWQPLFGSGGFRRLQTEGAWFKNCHYPYSYTLTAPGHASLSTGTYPSKHGIIANDWYDRATGLTVSSVTPPPEKRQEGLGPYRRSVPTIGDMLLSAVGIRGRVASFSIKDRAAILMAALRAQFCYWLDEKTGDFVTSPYYRSHPHSWVKEFNAKKLLDSYLNRDWVRLRDDLDYAAYSGPDDFFAEGIGYRQGRVFPHPTLPKGTRGKDPYFATVENSPFGNDFLLEFVKTAIAAEKLGQTDSVDMLFVSFSSNDLVGHCWGPDSQEVLDITLRSDRLIEDLLRTLDTSVGRGKYVFAVAADHGVCPLPEFAAKEGKATGRVAPEILTSLAEAHLNSALLPNGEKANWFEAPAKYNPWIYLNRGTLKSLSLERQKVERVLADWMSEQPGILKAFTRTEVESATENSSPLLAAMRRSFRPESSGDVMIVLEPYHLFSPPLLSKDPSKIDSYRTTHGTPHPYDTHIPLLVMGPGIRPGPRDDRVAPQALASILSEILRVPPPSGREFPVPRGLLQGR